MSAAPAPEPETSASANGGRLSSLKLDGKRNGYQERMRWAAEFGSRPVLRGGYRLLRRRSLLRAP